MSKSACITEASQQDTALETQEKDLNLELLKSRFKAQQNLCTDYGKGCVVWLVALGFMLKYAFDQNISHELQNILRYGAICFSSMGIFLNYYIYKAMTGIDSDIKLLTKKLNSKLSHLTTEKLPSILIASAIFDGTVIIILILSLKYGI